MAELKADVNREPRVSDATDRLYASLGQLEQVAEELEKRLDPVLDPRGPEPCDADKSAHAGPFCALTLKLLGLNEQTCRVQRLLSVTLERLSL